LLQSFSMIDRKHIGKTLGSHIVTIRTDNLRRFARATGQNNPLYLEEGYARAMGHPALPVPPTYLFCLDFMQADPYAWLFDMGVNQHDLLHAGQYFLYHSPLYAGENVKISSRIADIYDKTGRKSGTLTFIIKETLVTTTTDTRDRLRLTSRGKIAEMRSTFAVRHTPTAAREQSHA